MRPLQLEFYACHSLPLCAVSAVAFCKRMCRPWSAVGGHYGKGFRKFGCGNGVGIWEASAYHLWVDEPIDARWGQTTFGRSAGCGEMLLGGCYMICVTGDTTAIRTAGLTRFIRRFLPVTSSSLREILEWDSGMAAISARKPFMTGWSSRITQCCSWMGTTAISTSSSDIPLQNGAAERCISFVETSCI